LLRREDVVERGEEGRTQTALGRHQGWDGLRFAKERPLVEAERVRKFAATPMHGIKRYGEKTSIALRCAKTNLSARGSGKARCLDSKGERARLLSRFGDGGLRW